MDHTFSKVQNEELNPFSLIACSLGILSSAMLITTVVLWINEYSCICNIEKKDFLSVVRKFNNGSTKKLFLYFCISILSLAYYLYFCPNIEILHPIIGTISIAAFFFLQEPNSVEISSILESNNINVGSGAAQQYFNGYLKILMSEETNSWNDRIQKFKNHHLVDIYSKFIILLPESCQNCSLLIEDSHVPEMRMANSLEPLKLNISGIERTFHSTVYVIDERIWFVAEYVPPLTTFCKMLHSGTGHVFTATDKREQYILFCQHLKKLIEQDVYCADKCLLVQYDDKKEQSLSELIIKQIDDDGLQVGRSAS